MRYLGLLVLAGCFLPVGTGAPMPATTLGRGHFGVAISAEAPTVDLVAEDKGSNASTDYTSSYAGAPAAWLSFGMAYGLTDDTDLEGSIDGELWLGFLPLPTGLSAGLRHHLGSTDALDFAIAGRVGGVSLGDAEVDASGNATNDTASALYGALQFTVQKRWGWGRPLLALNVMPFRITRAIDGDPLQKFDGIATSLTFALMLVGEHVQAGPYITGTDFESQQFSGGAIVSGGIMFSVRPDRNRRPRVEPVYAPPPPPSYGPPGGAAPPPPPPPAGG
ncbi:MAG TPA: hypothetical protein VLX92_34730 [Kofleriaceae bacterium]|nr:hypothetical protein [Kofleriaceae bacterium]